ncbi:Multiple inositol polyphosphate phosphatase 1 [Pseudolycoriella hygida]|uniref:Multiple inositol polyphosphate phosphatase 1 n=1 Tax=Pseudolycoriella hygida TaxID=35572 RepID=A0A9Q0S5E7_9DIPT|nr:Multiple inositol polyphosphate phosphatase 1 [Pseudolycoriella hygida]
MLKGIVLLLTFSFALTNGSVSVHNPFYCYADDPIKPQHGMFSTTSAYETTRGDSVDAGVSSCTPSKFWLITRHGTRLPSLSDLTLIFRHNENLHSDIVRNFESGRTSLCASDINLIKEWKFDPNITFENEQFLTVSGWNEARQVAERYQSAFPSLLPSTYSRDTYFFRSTATQRTIGTLHAFADGLFGFNGHEQVEFEDIAQPDVLLRPYQFCPLYDEIANIRAEQNAFVEGPEYQEMIVQVSQKLGFHGSHVLRAEEIQTLSILCRFEQIWDMNATSPLCAAFSIANFQVMEYWSDLYYYYRWGYGQRNYRRLFENLPCHLIQDMLHFIRSEDANDNRVRIFGAHLPSLYLTLVSFGAFDGDAPLNRHNFAQQTFRMWKSSNITPMAANLAVIRYDCEDGDNDVLFLHNEKPLQIPGCQPNGLCKQSFLLEKFSRFLDINCSNLYCTNA